MNNQSEPRVIEIPPPWPQRWHIGQIREIVDLALRKNTSEKADTDFLAARALQNAISRAGHPDPRRINPEPLTDALTDSVHVFPEDFVEIWPGIRFPCPDPLEFAANLARHEPRKIPRLENPHPRIQRAKQIANTALILEERTECEFFMPIRKLADILGVNYTTAQRDIQLLLKHNILIKKEPADHKKRTAATFRVNPIIKNSMDLLA